MTAQARDPIGRRFAPAVLRSASAQRAIGQRKLGVCVTL